MLMLMNELVFIYHLTILKTELTQSSKSQRREEMESKKSTDFSE